MRTFNYCLGILGIVSKILLILICEPITVLIEEEPFNSGGNLLSSPDNGRVIRRK
jgi:hypothetical protein